MFLYSHSETAMMVIHFTIVLIKNKTAEKAWNKPRFKSVNQMLITTLNNEILFI